MKIYLLLFALVAGHVHAEWELIFGNGADRITSDGERLYASTKKGIYYSRDDGYTWRLGDFNDYINDLTVSPGAIYGYSSEHGILRSVTKGNTWHWKNNGFDPKWDGNRSYYPYLRRFFVTGSGMVIAVGYHSGTWISRDRGDSWHNVTLEWVAPQSPGSSDIDLGTGIWSMGEHDGYLWALYSIDKAARSPDEGATWESIPDWGNERSIRHYSPVEAWISFRGDLYVGGGGFGRWREEGLEWEDLSESLPKLVRLSCLVVHRDWIFGGSRSHGVFMFDHHAETWYPADLSGKRVFSLASHRGNLYAAGLTRDHDGIYRAKRPLVSPEGKAAVAWGAIKLGNTK